MDERVDIEKNDQYIFIQLFEQGYSYSTIRLKYYYKTDRIDYWMLHEWLNFCGLELNNLTRAQFSEQVFAKIYKQYRKGVRFEEDEIFRGYQILDDGNVSIIMYDKFEPNMPFDINMSYDNFKKLIGLFQKIIHKIEINTEQFK